MGISGIDIYMIDILSILDELDSSNATVKVAWVDPNISWPDWLVRYEKAVVQVFGAGQATSPEELRRLPVCRNLWGCLWLTTTSGEEVLIAAPDSEDIYCFKKSSG